MRGQKRGTEHKRRKMHMVKGSIAVQPNTANVCKRRRCGMLAGAHLIRGSVGDGAGAVATNIVSAARDSRWSGTKP